MVTSVPSTTQFTFFHPTATSSRDGVRHDQRRQSVTITTAAHGFAVGQQVTIAGFLVPG